MSEQKKELKCNSCGAAIYFDKNAPKSQSGKMIPQDFLRPGNPHNCPNRQKPKPQLGEESPERIAHESVKQEYADGAKKGHEENIAMHKEAMTQGAQLIAEISLLRQAINGLGVMLKNVNEDIAPKLARIADKLEG